MAVASAAGISSQTTARAARQARNNWATLLRTTPLIAFRWSPDRATDRDIAGSADSVRPTTLSRPAHHLFRAIDTDLLQSLPDTWLKQASWAFLVRFRRWAKQPTQKCTRHRPGLDVDWLSWNEMLDT